jgi:hypothetical protein
MADLKKKIEKIFEAPIPDSQMPASGHYMSDDHAFRRASANVAPLLKQIHDYIKNMSWREISFDTSGSANYVMLPAPVRTLMSKMYGCNSEYHKPLEMYGGSATRALNNKEKEFYSKIAHFNLSTISVDENDPLDTRTSGLYVFRGVEHTGSTYNINMTCGNPGDRTHFPNNGINKGLKTLGQKLYRALVQKYGYVQTNSGGTGIKDLMWDSLTDYKYNPDGTRSVADEVYSFRINDALYVIATGLDMNTSVQYGRTVLNKVTDKSRLVSPEARKSSGLAIDPDYIQMLKTALPTMSASTKAMAEEVIEWVAPDPARAAERERIRRDAEEAENNARNARLAGRLMAFCGVSRIQDLTSDWNIGDWIVVREYLLNDSADIKLRKIVKKEDGVFTALKNTDLPAFNTNGTMSDNRQTRDTAKSVWVKALPPAVGTNLAPGTYNIPASARRESGGTTVTPAATTPAATTPASVTNVITSNLQSMFTKDAGKDVTYNFENPVRKRFLTRTIDNNFMYLSPAIPADCKMNGTPIFGYFMTGTVRKTIYNSKTMEDNLLNADNWVAISASMTKYKRVPVSDKRELTTGSLVFIKQHSKYFGYVAKVLSTSLTSRGDKYVYLRVPGAGSSDRLTLTPIALDKLVVATNESSDKEYVSLFGKLFENYLDNID